MMPLAVGDSMEQEEQLRLDVDDLDELRICSGVKLFPVVEGGGATCAASLLYVYMIRRVLGTLQREWSSSFPTQEASRLHLHCKPKVSAVSDLGWCSLCFRVVHSQRCFAECR